jgi:RNA polymerase sigma-70 factor (ECF subfamily)
VARITRLGGTPRLPKLDDKLTALYRTYGPIIHARCLRLLGDAQAAEDATQETFVRVHRHIDRAPDFQSALGWIYRIATNYCLNEIRDRKRRAEPRDRLPDSSGESAEDLLADRDFVARLIDRAPEELRVPAWLHHIDGIDQGEVARMLGVSRRTVVNRLALFAKNAHDLAERSAA